MESLTPKVGGALDFYPLVFNPQGKEESKKSEDTRVCTYLDPDLFDQETNGSEKELASEFICLICTGTALNPIECNSCNNLYCSHCIPDK